MSVSLDQARQAWIKDEPRYHALGKVLARNLTEVIRYLGISADITYRTKEIDSLLRKLWLKKHHTYDSMPDKLGLRIVVRYEREADAIIRALPKWVNCQQMDVKADGFESNRVGYRATHLQVRLLAGDPAAVRFTPTQYTAELQVHTLAQHLWAEMAHDVFYKDPQVAGPELQRRVYLLAGLIEVADNEFSRIDVDIAHMPELRNVAILRALEKQYFKLAANPGNRALSLEVIERLAPLYGDTPGDWAKLFEMLFVDKETVLRTVFDAQLTRPEGRSAFFFQPEVLMIYDRLLCDGYRLRETWNRVFPEDELERIANVFGLSFD